MTTLEIAIYLVGYFVTLILLFVFKKQLGIDSYNEPHPEYYDDWSSNVSWSIIWPLCWVAFVTIIVWKILISIGKVIEKITT